MQITYEMFEVRKIKKNWVFLNNKYKKTGPLPLMLHQNPYKNPNLRAGAQATLAALRFGFLDGF